MHQVVTRIIRDLIPKRLGLSISKDIKYRYIIWLLNYQNINMVFNCEYQDSFPELTHLQFQFYNNRRPYPASNNVKIDK